MVVFENASYLVDDTVRASVFAELRRLRSTHTLFRRSMKSLATLKRRNDGDTLEDAHRDWIDGNDEFHLAVLDAAGNERLRAALADLHVSFPRDLTWIVLGESSHLLEENVAQHAAVLEAIERRDAEEARRRMVDHVLSAGELVVRRFEERAA